MSVSSSSNNSNSAKPKNVRLRKRLRACLPHFHAAAPETEADAQELRGSESAAKMPSRASDPTPGHSLGVADTNHSWSDTEDMSPVSIKPRRSLFKRRQDSSPPCSSPSSSSSSSSSTSSTFSVARKGVTYGLNGALVRCRFCEILQSGDEPFLYEDEDVVVFRPLAPVVVSHILVVPRRHIRNVNKLTPDDTALLRRMREVAAMVLREMPRPSVVLAPSKAEKAHDAAEDCTDDDDSEADFKFAFHSPPFNSIDHVHMHAFRTRDGRFGCVGSIKYRTETWWCRSFDEVMTRLGLRTRKQRGDDSSAPESAMQKNERRRRNHASHPPCGSEVHSNGSMVLTSVESLG
ncbi:hypothetical protein PR003_g20691 [Phytophthora rubi]|uniref:HIT domain-containing protein n=1 Tax=Phytophthora rubi TaxID=129364 RepID=A0A6A3JRP6_9STRA|nr:hypothetical protein PR002_g20620 [Phytophthora rubi]KAE8996108.1 hypothetical protein PR001_g19946 [Phytophthora rubi]KAE9308651.1 hypothetical protein PR003_g20691 [Phytophthora rubi]